MKDLKTGKFEGISHRKREGSETHEKREGFEGTLRHIRKGQRVGWGTSVKVKCLKIPERKLKREDTIMSEV